MKRVALACGLLLIGAIGYLAGGTHHPPHRRHVALPPGIDLEGILQPADFLVVLNATPILPCAPACDSTAPTCCSCSVALSWSDNSGVPQKYQINRSTDGTTFTTILSATTPGQTTYTDVGLAPSTAYYYKLELLAPPPVGVDVIQVAGYTTTGR